MTQTHYDEQYLSIGATILDTGVTKQNRTNLDSIMIPSAFILWDLRDGFPVLTTKQVYYKQAIGEVLGFIRGYTNAKDFEKLGCKWWYSDANENKTWLKSPYRRGEDDLGVVYGSVWRSRRVYKEVYSNNTNLVDYLVNEEYMTLVKYLEVDSNFRLMFKDIDQLSEVCDKIVYTPDNRRNIMHAWFPELFDEMALPPCHVMYEFVTDTVNNVLHMTMTQRSTDFLLGAPMNLFGSALLLELVAKATGYTAGQLTHSMTDVHFYSNQLDAFKEQFKRTPLEPPMIKVKDKLDTQSPIDYLESLEPEDIMILDYDHCGPISKVEMAQEK